MRPWLLFRHASLKVIVEWVADSLLTTNTPIQVQMVEIGWFYELGCWLACLEHIVLGTAFQKHSPICLYCPAGVHLLRRKKDHKGKPEHQHCRSSYRRMEHLGFILIYSDTFLWQNSVPQHTDFRALWQIFTVCCHTITVTHRASNASQVACTRIHQGYAGMSTSISISLFLCLHPLTCSLPPRCSKP